MTPYRKITQAELLTEAKTRFGDDPMTYAFECPNCRDVATLADFRDAGADPNRAGQECIGRSLGACAKPTPTNSRGCDWAAFGLFHGPWEIVMPAEGGKPERSVWSFPLAPAPGDAKPVDHLTTVVQVPMESGTDAVGYRWECTCGRASRRRWADEDGARVAGRRHVGGITSAYRR